MNNKMNELEEFKKDLEEQKKKVDEKIEPILQSYREGKITTIDLVEQLSDAFYKLEEDEKEEDKDIIKD